MFLELTAGPGSDSEANCDKNCTAGGAVSDSGTVIEKAADFGRLSKNAQVAVNEVESVRNLARVLSSERGRKSILNLDRAGARLCIDILDKVRLPSTPSTIHGCSLTDVMIQGLAEQKLRADKRQIFLNTLIKLAGKHSRLPSSMVITERNDFSCSSQIYASGGFADIRQGRCNGCTVAVKTLRLSQADNPEQTRKVSRESIFVFRK